MADQLATNWLAMPMTMFPSLGLYTEHLLGKFIHEVKANHYIDTFYRYF